MKTNINFSGTIFPDYENSFPNHLSLTALGIFIKMVNLPELDYCSLETLCSYNPTEPEEVVRAAVMELYREGLVLRVIFKDKDVFIVNKSMLTRMKLVR